MSSNNNITLPKKDKKENNNIKSYDDNIENKNNNIKFILHNYLDIHIIESEDSIICH